MQSHYARQYRLLQLLHQCARCRSFRRRNPRLPCRQHLRTNQLLLSPHPNADDPYFQNLRSSENSKFSARWNPNSTILDHCQKNRKREMHQRHREPYRRSRAGQCRANRKGTLYKQIIPISDLSCLQDFDDWESRLHSELILLKKLNEPSNENRIHLIHLELEHIQKMRL